MPQRAKNHHIVPKVLQKQFAISEDETRVWHAKRVQGEQFPKPEKKRIQKAFVARDYYTITLADEPSDSLETIFYGGIDDFLGKLIPAALKTLNQRKIPALGPPVLEGIHKIVPEMIKRTPDFMGRYNDAEYAENVIKSKLAENPDAITTEQLDAMNRALADPKKLQEYGRNVRMISTVNTNQALADAMSEFSVKWAVSRSKHSFILSRRMAYMLSKDNPIGLKNPDVQIWMPISPKAALLLIRDPNKNIPDLKFCNSNEIRQINRYALATSTEIASHSNTLLKSLIGRQ